MTVIVPIEMYEAISREAETRGVSRSAIVRWALKDRYDRYKAEDWRERQSKAGMGMS
jgi:hypothetical protein